MKSFSKTIFYIFILAGLFVIGCQKKHEVHFNQRFPLETAKNFYDLKSNSNELNSVAANPVGHPNNNPRAPIWEKSIYYQSDNEDVIEVPLTFKYQRGLQLQTVSSWVPDNTEGMNLRKLIFIRGSDGNIQAAIMTIIPATPTLLNAIDFSYKKVKANFNGLVLYHGIDDQFITGWRYEQGKLKRKVSNEQFRDRPKNNTEGLSVTDPLRECYTVVVTRWCQNCTDWFVNGVYDRTSCSSPYACGQYSYEECELAGCLNCGGLPPNGGGTPPPAEDAESCNNSLNTFIAQSATSSETINTITTYQDEKIRKRTYQWKILTNLGWHLYSLENGVHVKNQSNAWIWQSLKHSDIKQSGTAFGLTIQVSVRSADAQLSQYHAVMPLNFHVLYSLVCKGSPVTRGLDYSSIKYFTINEPGISENVE